MCPSLILSNYRSHFVNHSSFFCVLPQLKKCTHTLLCAIMDCKNHIDDSFFAIPPLFFVLFQYSYYLCTVTLFV